jgi:hypothetical protein
MEPRTRRISAVATAAALGIPAATAAVPALGIVGGLIATAAIAAGSVAGFFMMVPETPAVMSPRQRLNPDVKASFETLYLACDGIRRTEIEAALRHSAQAMLLIANEASATVADISFVILNMESLLGIAEAWKKTESSDDPQMSDELLVTYTINTIIDVTRNARQRRDGMAKRSKDSLQIELAVTRRITEEDRKGMQP